MKNLIVTILLLSLPAWAFEETPVEKLRDKFVSPLTLSLPLKTEKKSFGWIQVTRNIADKPKMDW